MEADVKTCKETFKEGYEAFEDSRKEANEVWDQYHNRHYTSEQLAILESRGQPKETFNVVKLFARMLVGYYSTVVNVAKALPVNPRDTVNATVLNDAIQHVFETSRFDIEGDQIKLGGLVSGLLCAFTAAEATEDTDQFGRTINKIFSKHVPDHELVLDPKSQLDNYEDASYLHRFKWLTEDLVVNTWGKEKLSKMEAYANFLNIDEAEYDNKQPSYHNSNYYGYGFAGNYRVHDNYLVVHTVIQDRQGKRWSMFWHDNILLEKKEITTRKVKWPYRVQKLHSSNKTEYYGIFREVVESQKAINQALLQIQLLANTTKVFVQDGAVDNIEEFKTAVNRVNGVIPVRSLSGIKIEQMSKEILDQYTLIDKSLDRIQRVLGVNDSFLGMAYASDSGRKVKLQQSATIMSLRYMTARIESFYNSLAWDIANLAKQFYTANQFLRITDAMSGQRWIEINKPMMQFSGEFDEQGKPIYQPILMEVLDPDNGEPMVDKEGNILLAPVPEEGTDFEFTDFDIKVESSAYNDEDEKGQLMLESVMSGQIGQMLAQVNPAGFFQISSLAMKSMGTKYSPQISEILKQTSDMLSQNPQAQQGASEMAQGGSGAQQSRSEALKLPSNTNEGV